MTYREPVRMLEPASNFQAFGKEVFFPAVKMDVVTLVVLECLAASKETWFKGP